MAEANWHPKRESRQFEPPPWEREQFEALQQRREQEAPIEERPAAEETPVAMAPAEPAQGPEAKVAAAAKPEVRCVPDAEVEAMLLQLQAEEPKVDEHVRSVTVFSSAIAMLLGVSMFAWGSFALLTAQKTLATVVGALIVLGMGLVFGLTGLWAGWRATNKQEERS